MGRGDEKMTPVTPEMFDKQGRVPCEELHHPETLQLRAVLTLYCHKTSSPSYNRPNRSSRCSQTLFVLIREEEERGLRAGTLGRQPSHLGGQLAADALLRSPASASHSNPAGSARGRRAGTAFASSCC